MFVVVGLSLILGFTMARTLPVFALLPVVLAIVLVSPPAVLLTGSLTGAAFAIIAVQAGFFAGSMIWTGDMGRTTQQVLSFTTQSPSNRKTFNRR